MPRSGFPTCHLCALFIAACAPAAPPTAPAPRPAAEAETRALWITRFDWTGAAELEALIDRAAAAGFNTIYLQARTNADAFYTPGLEPWAPRLAGALGADPGWDPLATAARRATAHGLELHAWINVFTGWSGADPPPATAPPHALLTDPDWFMADTLGAPLPQPDVRWLSPAHPAVRARAAAVAADLGRRYPIAGVHLDFVRYPARDPADSLSIASWRAARAAEPALTLDEQRRALVTAAVREIRDSLRASAPGLALSAAVWGVYRAPAGWAGVSTGYDDRLQDARAWAQLGLVDVVVPMVYWPIGRDYGERLDYAFLVDEHVRAMGRADVVIGVSLETLTDADALNRHIERARQAGAAGIAVLSARLMNELDLWAALARGAFRTPARAP